MAIILIIDDDLHIVNVLEETLTNEGYGVILAYSGTVSYTHLTLPTTE